MLMSIDGNGKTVNHGYFFKFEKEPAQSKHKAKYIEPK